MWRVAPAASTPQARRAVSRQLACFFDSPDSTLLVSLLPSFVVVHLRGVERLSVLVRLVGLSAVTAVRGVSHAVISLMTPISGLHMSVVLNVPAAPVASAADRTVNVNYVSPGRFATYRTPVVDGGRP